MPALLVRGGLPDKGFQHEAMDHLVGDNTVDAQANLHVPFAVGMLL